MIKLFENFNDEEVDESEQMVHELDDGEPTDNSVWLKRTDINDLIKKKFVEQEGTRYYFNKSDVEDISDYLETRDDVNKYNL